jgi:hypothetical protein
MTLDPPTQPPARLVEKPLNPEVPLSKYQNSINMEKAYQFTFMLFSLDSITIHDENYQNFYCCHRNPQRASMCGEEEENMLQLDSRLETFYRFWSGGERCQVVGGLLFLSPLDCNNMNNESIGIS